VKVLTPTLHLLQTILQVYEKIEGLAGPVLGPVGTTAVEAGLGYAAFKKIQATALAQDIAGTTGVTGAVARAAGVMPTVAAAAPTAAAAAAPVVAEMWDPHAAFRRPGDAPILIPKPVAASAAITEAATAAVGVNTTVTTANTAAKVRETLAANALIAAEGRAALAKTGIGAAFERTGISTLPLANVLSKAGPFLLGLSALLAIDHVVKQSTSSDAYDAKDLKLLASGKSDAKSLRNSADALDSLRASRDKTLDSSADFNNYYVSPFSKGPHPFDVRTGAEAALFREMAKGAEVEQKYAESLRSISVFGDAANRTTDQITQGFDELAHAGEGASGSLTQYFNALMTQPADTLGTYEQPETTANTAVTQIGVGTNAYIDSLGKNIAPGGKVGKAFADFWHSSQSITSRIPGVGEIPNPFGDNKGDVARHVDLGPQLKSVQDYISKWVGFGGPGLDQKAMNNIIRDAVGQLDTSEAEGEYSTFDGKKYKAQLIKRLVKKLRVVNHQVNELGVIGPDELSSLVQQQSAALQDVDPADPHAGVAQAKVNLQELLQRKRAGGGATFEAQEIAIRNARHQYRDLAVAEAEDLRKAAEARASGQSDAKQAAVRLKGAKVSFRRAGDDVAELRSLMDNLDRATVRALISFRETAVQTAKVAYEKQLELINQAQTLLNLDLGGPAMSGHPGPGAGGQDPNGHVAGRGKADRLKQRYIRQEKALKAAEEALTGAIMPDATFPGNSSSANNLTAWQQRALRGQALASPNNAVSQARHGLDVARANLAAIKDKHSSEYFSALQAVTTAEQTLASSLGDRTTAAANLAAAAAGGGQRAAAIAQLAAARVQQRLAAKNGGKAERDNAEAAVLAGHTAMQQSHAQDAAAAASVRAARAGGGQMAQAREALTSARARLHALRQERGTSEWNDAYAAYLQAQQGMRDAVSSKIGARASATAARRGGGIADARAAIAGAAASLHAAARGTAEWYQALASYYQGQQSMRDAVLAYRNNLALLRGDSTDPVEQARDAMRAATRKLRQDRRRGAGKDVRAEDRVAEQDSRNALERAKFDQRFSDMQTNEDLGRISFAKYMDYLDHEHDRLTRIKHRTRQQQDELDQVDKAMKDALNSMDSQFNLGDINTRGLVYQVRRFKAEAGAQAPSAAAGNTTHQTVSISINGADTAKVKTIIDGYLRIGGGQRQTLTRRKV
jgi:hypothetical protein